jgi:hydrogenase-4 component E
VLEFLLAFILIFAIIMSGLRRINLLTQGYIIQSITIALLCLVLGNKTGEGHYYLLGILTFVMKVIIIPYIIFKSVKDLKINREMELIINGYWSYILAGAAVAVTHLYLANYNNDILKAGIVLMIVGAMLLVGRKKAITQMIGFLTLENGLVLFEISAIEMVPIIELGIILEVLMLALIMGIMIFHINKTFDTVNTDYLSNLKE